MKYRKLLVIDFCLLIISLILLVFSKNLPLFSSFGFLGSGFVPLLTSGALVLALICTTFSDYKDYTLAKKETESTANIVVHTKGLLNAVICVALVGLSIVFTNDVGFPICLTIISYLILTITEKMKFLHALIFSVLFVGFIHIIFIAILQVPIPMGLLTGI